MTDPKSNPGCPMLNRYDPLTAEHAIDPEPWMAAARRDAPVFYLQTLQQWCVTRPEDVDGVLRDAVSYSSADAVTISPKALARMPDGYFLEDAIAAVDPPQHTRMRKLAAGAFTPRQAEKLAGTVRAMADELIDGFPAGGPVDLATAFCQQIPIRVVATILGIDVADAEDLYAWSVDGLMLQSDPNMADADIDRAVGTQLRFDRYIRDLIADRRARDRGDTDLVSRLVRAESDAGEPALSEREIVGIVANVMSAGADTAATTMGNCIHTLLQERHHWEAVVADPGLVPAAIEETLRYRPPFRSLPRTATRDVEIAGVPIAKGERLLTHVHSAHHDEQAFDHPDTFDLHRPNIRNHMGFGKGIHYCLGAPLARVEMREAIGALARRLPGMTLVPGHELHYLPGIVVLPLRSGLVVEWAP
jgi:cytochrome P450